MQLPPPTSVDLPLLAMPPLPQPSATSSSSADSELSRMRSKLTATNTRVRERDGTVTNFSGLTSASPITLGKPEKHAPTQWELDAQNGITRLNPRVWDDATSAWAKMRFPPTAAAAGLPTRRSQLRIATYNVWFSRRNWRARARALFKLLDRNRGGKPDFDVIALQEVTPRFLHLLREEEFVQQRYALSDSVGTTFIGKPKTAYGVLFLIKRDLIAPCSADGAAAALPAPFRLSSLAIHALPSQMSRRVLVLVLDEAGDDGRRLALATVHLESLGFQRLRVMQLETIGKILDETGAETALVCGDFNCGPDGPVRRQPENTIFTAAGFSDVWPLLHPDDDDGDRGVTLPFPLGTVMKKSGDATGLEHAEQHCRIDRIILRSRGGDEEGGAGTARSAVTALSIEMCGDVSVDTVLRSDDSCAEEGGGEGVASRAPSIAAADEGEGEGEGEEEGEGDGERRGEGAGPDLDILYLHGFGETDPGNCRVARSIKATTGATVHTPCYHPEGDYRLTNVAQTIDELVVLIRSTRAGTVVVVGYSVGGFLAALLAAVHPELVHGLVLLAPAIDNYERNFCGRPESEWYMPRTYVQTLIDDFPSRPPVDTSAVCTVILHGLRDTDRGGSASWRVREFAAAIGAVLHEPDCDHGLEPWLSLGSTSHSIPSITELIAVVQRKSVAAEVEKTLSLRPSSQTRPRTTTRSSNGSPSLTQPSPLSTQRGLLSPQAPTFSPAAPARGELRVTFAETFATFDGPPLKPHKTEERNPSCDDKECKLTLERPSDHLGLHVLLQL